MPMYQHEKAHVERGDYMVTEHAKARAAADPSGLDLLAFKTPVGKVYVVSQAAVKRYPPNGARAADHVPVEIEQRSLSWHKKRAREAIRNDPKGNTKTRSAPATARAGKEPLQEPSDDPDDLPDDIPDATDGLVGTVLDLTKIREESLSLLKQLQAASKEPRGQAVLPAASLEPRGKAMPASASQEPRRMHPFPEPSFDPNDPASKEPRRKPLPQKSSIDPNDAAGKEHRRNYPPQEPSYDPDNISSDDPYLKEMHMHRAAGKEPRGKAPPNQQRRDTPLTTHQRDGDRQQKDLDDSPTPSPRKKHKTSSRRAALSESPSSSDEAPRKTKRAKKPKTSSRRAALSESPSSSDEAPRKAKRAKKSKTSSRKAARSESASSSDEAPSKKAKKQKASKRARSQSPSSSDEEHKRRRKRNPEAPPDSWDAVAAMHAAQIKARQDMELALLISEARRGGRR